MTKHYDANPPYIKAAEDMVLCDGYNMTSLGGRVFNMDTATLDTWQEMAEAAAQALISRNAGDPDEEISDEEFGAMVKEVL